MYSKKYLFKICIEDYFSKCERIFREFKNIGNSFVETDVLLLPIEFDDVTTTEFEYTLKHCILNKYENKREIKANCIIYRYYLNQISKWTFVLCQISVLRST